MKKLPYWLKGGLVGAGLSTLLIIILIFIVLIFGKYYFYLSMFFAFPSSILLLVLLALLLGGIKEIGVLGIFLFNVINWFLLGALIGLVVGEIKEKKITKWLTRRLKNKRLIRILAIIIIISVIVCLLLIFLYFLWAVCDSYASFYY